MCCMTEEVCGALPSEATRSGARESPWRPTQLPAMYFLAPPQPACVLPPSALSARHMLDQ